MFHAAWHGFTRIAEVLVAAGANLNVRNLRGNACIGDLYCLFLFDVRITPSPPSLTFCWHMRTPDMAIERGQVDTVKSMLRYGSDATLADVLRVQHRMGRPVARQIVELFEYSPKLFACPKPTLLLHQVRALRCIIGDYCSPCTLLYGAVL